MKKIIKVLIGIATIIGITAIIKYLFCEKEKTLLEISTTDDMDITEELNEELDEESSEEVVE